MTIYVSYVKQFPVISKVCQITDSKEMLLQSFKTDFFNAIKENACVDTFSVFKLDIVDADYEYLSKCCSENNTTELQSYINSLPNKSNDYYYHCMIDFDCNVDDETIIEYATDLLELDYFNDKDCMTAVNKLDTDKDFYDTVLKEYVDFKTDVLNSHLTANASYTD